MTVLGRLCLLVHRTSLACVLWGAAPRHNPCGADESRAGRRALLSGDTASSLPFRGEWLPGAASSGGVPFPGFLLLGTAGPGASSPPAREGGGGAGAAAAAMSLLSLLLPMLRVYLLGWRVVLHQLLRRLRPGSPSKLAFPHQNGNVAIVTGGTKGIGYHTAKHLASLGMHVIIAANNEDEGQETVMKIKEETLNAKVEFLYCDLASMKSIHQFVDTFKAKNCPLHVLINNAGVMLVPERKTEDGFEEHFAVNYLGHFLLTNLLLDILKQSGTHSHNARVVNMSSATHYVGELHLNDLQSSCFYSPYRAYAQSKLALVLFTYYLQQLLTGERSHVTINVVDPGVVNTSLYQNIGWVPKMVKWMTGWLFLKTPEEGASTLIYAAVSPELEGVGACYLYNEQRTKSVEVSYDEEVQKRLWTESCKLVGIPNMTP